MTSSVTSLIGATTVVGPSGTLLGASSEYNSTYTTTEKTVVTLGASSVSTLQVKTITTKYLPSTSSVAINTTNSPAFSIFSSTTNPSSTSSTISASSSTLLASSAASSKSHNEVSSGAAAGIGVGCVIIGALIGIACGLFFFRNRQDRPFHRRGGGTGKPGSTYASEKEPMAAGGVVAALPPSSNDLDNLLPQEADDNTIRNKASTLFDQLQLHVENFYHDVKVPITPVMEAELSRYSSPYFSESLVAVLNSTSSPTTVIKHCLAYHVMNLTSATTVGPTRLLLPPEISEMVSAMNKGSTRKPTPDTGLAFSRWRQLTAYLRPELLSNTRAEDAEQSRAADEAAHSFIRVFAPWARPEHSEIERTAHLKHIINNAVLFALWLFAQPAAFKYDWKPSADVRDRAGRAVVVAPGLVKVSDGRGQVLPGAESRHVMVGPVVRKV